MKQIEHAGIVFMNITRPVVAQVLAYTPEGFGIISISVTVDDIKPLFGVCVKKVKSIRGFGGECRLGAGITESNNEDARQQASSN